MELLTGYEQSKFNTDASVLPTVANETINKETGDDCPVFCSVFARSAQSAERLPNTQRPTNQLCMSTISPLFSFFTVCGWKEKDVFL